MKQDIIPVYLIAGFLESGKTSMIRNMLEDEGFSSGQKTLILCCEEGEEELDTVLLNRANADLVVLDEAEQLTSLRLKELNAKYSPERVIVEYNTMWTMEKLAALNLPPYWQWVQVITLADGTTFENYMTNIRKMITDPMRDADLILINRCGPSFNKSSWRKQLRALNPSANILFENLDGSTEDGVTDEDLPYDMKADIIDVTDEQFGILYLDAMDHPERYDGKVVRMVGQAFPQREFPQGVYLFARYAMTCCSNDVQPIGWLCQGAAKPSTRNFIRLTARCHMQPGPENQRMLTLEEVKAERCNPPKEKFVTFTNL